MWDSKHVEGERIEFCSLPRGDELGFVYSATYKPGEGDAQRIDKVMKSLVRERMALIGTEIVEENVQRWSQAYPRSLIVIGGSEEKPLEVWGYEMLRRSDSQGVTVVMTLPVEGEDERAGIVARLRAVWPTAEALPVGCARGSSAAEEHLARMLREGKHLIIFK